MRQALLIVLVGLTVSPAALAEPETTAPACALHQPRAPRAHGFGTIIGIQDAARSRAGIAGREAQQGGAIDPRYLGDQRVMVRLDDGTIDTFDVSEGMTAHVGDRVRLQGSYRSVFAACSYVPHMAVPDDAPLA